MSTATASPDTIDQWTAPAATVATLTLSTNAIITTTLTVHAPSVATVGQPVLLTAHIAPVRLTAPTGTVIFQDGSVTLATVSLTGSNNAAFITSTLSLGTHAISASYSGDSNFAASSSAVANVAIDQIATTTTLSVPGTTVAGQPTKFVATVSSSPSHPINGVVTFFDGTTSIGSFTVTPDLSAPIITFPLKITTLSVGTHSITASYASSDPNVFGSTSAAQSETVVAVGTTASTTTLSIAPTSIAYGSPVIFTASVTGAGTPTGYVTINQGSNAGVVLLIGPKGLAVLDTTTYPALRLNTVGTHTFTATYSGDATFAASSSTATLTVTALATTTTVSSAPNSFNANQDIKLKATVTGTAFITPAGTVTFLDGTNSLGTAALDLGGVAIFPTTALGAGTHSITAVYAGQSNTSGSTSSAVSMVANAVGTSATSTTLSASTDSTVVTAPVIFTAAVTSDSTGTPSGTVTFTQGNRILGTVPVGPGGQAVYTSSLLTNDLPIGSDTVVATYNGDATYAPSHATAVVNVTPLIGTTTVTVSPSPVGVGQDVTITASVTTSGAAASGTMMFYDGSTALGSSNLDPSGAATLDTTNLAAGIHGIYAVYSGDTSNPGTTSQTVNLTVNPTGTATTTTTLTIGPESAKAGTPVTLSASVVGAGTTPSGTVTFMAGNHIIATIPVDATGTASFTTSTAPIGNFLVRAVYSGDNTFASSASGNKLLLIGTRNERYVAQLYLDLLGRAVDTGGLAAWVKLLDGGKSFSDIATAITSSREYDGIIVDALYFKYLGRHAELSGLNAWIDQMQAGLNAQVILAGILASAEYYGRTGGTDGSYIGALYETFLGRSPDSAGQKAWLGLLSDPSKRGIVASGISNSDENRTDIIKGFYQTYLRRDPDAGGLAAWKAQLAGGVSQPQIVAFFVTTSEYLNNNNLNS